MSITEPDIMIKNDEGVKQFVLTAEEADAVLKHTV